jgi:hypothetical protein
LQIAGEKPKREILGCVIGVPPLATDDAREEDLLDRLILEIKAAAMLYGTEAELREKLESKISESNDEQVKRFVKAFQMEGPARTGRKFALALGELLTSAILVFAGAVVLIPTVVGVNTLSSLVQYFAERTSGTVGTSPLSPYLSFMEFVVGVVLLLSAFFSLREAALNLKQAGLAVKSGES